MAIEESSPALDGRMCRKKYFSLLSMTPQGKFLARVTGKTRGNVLLREQQYAKAVWIQQSAWKLQKTVFLEKCIMRDGF